MRASPSQLVIRDATAADHDAVRAVLAAAYAQYERLLEPAMFTGYLADLVDLERRADASQLLVAAGDDAIVATVSFYPDASAEGMGWPHGWSGVRALGVHPDHRGRGAGRQLVEECLRRAQAWGAPTVGLHTAPFMRDAVRLYEAMGFVRTPWFDLDPAALLDVPSDPDVVASAYARLVH